MKKHVIISSSAIIIGIIGIGYYMNMSTPVLQKQTLQQYDKNKTPITLTQQNTPLSLESDDNTVNKTDNHENDFKSKNSAVTTYENPAEIDVKKITTTHQIQLIFPKFYLYAVSPVFIEKFPADFPEKGDANLFVKTMMPLILREQKNILADRDFLVTLKPKNQQSWTEIERAQFDALIQKYELTKEKLSVSQMDELLKRVDIIPMSLALAVSGVHTNWGQKNLTAPFGQKEWVDGQYVDKQFDSLGDAVQSYMKELNTLAIYDPMRTARQLNRHLKGSQGEKLLSYMDNYMRENPSYKHQIKEAFKTMKLGVLDEALLFD